MIDSDGHEIGALDYVELGVGQARRAWLTKDDVLNTRTWAQIQKLQEETVTFRDDLDRAADWVDAYLQRVATCRSRRASRPAMCARTLPDAPPEQGESFEAMLRDLDELIVPGLTHWNHPRFFAWFANTGSEPGVLAELLIAALNVNAFTWLSSPAATELEVTVMDWLAQLLGLPRGWHGHIEDTASTATIAALAAARTRRPGGVVVASEQANFSVEKAARLVGLEYRKAPVDDDVPHAPDIDLDGVTAVVATVGDDRDDLGRSRAASSPAAATTQACGCTSTPRTPARPRCAPSSAGASTGSTRPTRSSSTRTNGSSRRWTARRSGRGGPEAFHEAFALVPEYLAATPEAIDIKDYGPALGRRFRALKLWFVLRWYGAEGLRALIREHVRLAQLFAALVEAEPGWEVVAPHPFSTVCFRHVERDNDEIARAATATGEMFVATTKLRGADDHPPRDRQRADDRGGHPPRVGGARDRPRRDLRPVGDADRLGPRGERAHARRGRERVGFDFHERWSRAPTGTPRRCATVLPSVGVPADAMDEVCRLRLELRPPCLVPRPGAVETLRELRARGHRSG